MENRTETESITGQFQHILMRDYKSGYTVFTVLTPTRKKGILCTTTLNGLLQDIVPPGSGQSGTGAITDISAFGQAITAEFDSGIISQFTRDMVPNAFTCLFPDYP